MLDRAVRSGSAATTGGSVSQGLPTVRGAGSTGGAKAVCVFAVFPVRTEENSSLYVNILVSFV